jgi:DNA-binding transcriptional ArsR family regulator
VSLTAEAVLMRPLRGRLLEALAEPGSAASLGRKLAVPRQKVSYHLRELEKQGLVELVEERRRGNCVERIVRATARSYVVSAEALASLASDPDAARDVFSSRYLVAVSARTIRELAVLRERAEKAGKKLPSLTLQTEVRFGSAADRNAFSEELANVVARLVEKYHDGTAEGGRRFRLMVGMHPALAAPKIDDKGKP